MIKQISHEALVSIRQRLERLYPDRGAALTARFYHLIGRYGVGVTEAPIHRWDEHSAFLITYADMVSKEDETPLHTLHRFAASHLQDAISTIHILPFCPWSSDDGFSVKDYRAVEPAYGNWKDIQAMHQDFKLMFDLVLNHCSRQSAWFADYVKGIQPARHYFLEVDPETDLSAVTRPRPTPLLSRVMTKRDEQHVWTTFSADQVDLNWGNPDVLFEFLDILFFYLANGATVIRLDAVAFLWKKIGTTCLHLPETHEVVKLLRDVVQTVAPNVLLLTETNVPHEENISYFGDGDEAHMVYQFSLPPLLLHGLLNNTAEHLKNWAETLPAPREGCTFLNFTASHDGIGVRPLQGLIPPDQLNHLIGQMEDRGGRVSRRDNGDGTQSPYELNITWFSALSEPGDRDLGRQRFLCSQAVTLALQGIPAIYFQNLCAGENWLEGVEETGRNRTINRRKWSEEELDAILAEPDGDGAIVFAEMTRMLRLRAQHPAFHPDGAQRVLDLPPNLFGFERRSPDGGETILCLFNFSSSAVRLKPRKDLSIETGRTCHDLIDDRTFTVDARKILPLKPYQAAWLVIE